MVGMQEILFLLLPLVLLVIWVLCVQNEAEHLFLICSFLLVVFGMLPFLSFFGGGVIRSNSLIYLLFLLLLAACCFVAGAIGTTNYIETLKRR
jgi:hypothetical protein